MNIKIYSRNEIIKLSKAQFDSNTALISIYDTDDVPPKLTNKPQYTLFVAFDDVYADDIDEVNLDFFKPFDEKLAKRISQFIMRHQDDVDTFICQCQFGQSRSAGVAAAIKEYFDGDGQRIFDDVKFSPNKKVYKLLLNELKESEKIKMNEKTNMPIFGENDILYVYKEPWFTGFAPCFDNQLYSLACCKGRMRRNSIRHKFGKGGQDIWLLSIAGRDIIKNNKNDVHNSSKNNYKGGDVITLVKVKELLSWKEYSEKYFGKRTDAIYKYNSEKKEMRWYDNPYHRKDTMRKTDCGDELKDYANIKQIIVSDEYYLFKAGNKIPEIVTYREFTLKNNIKLIKDYMEKHPDSFEFCGKFNNDKAAVVSGCHNTNKDISGKRGCAK